MKKITSAFLPLIVLMMPRMCYRGIILYLCWLWFIVPIFGVAIIPLWYAIPISGLISILTFERIGEMASVEQAWLTVGRWSLGATVFLISALIFHLIGVVQ